MYFCIVADDTSPILQAKYPSDQNILFFQYCLDRNKPRSLTLSSSSVRLASEPFPLSLYKYECLQLIFYKVYWGVAQFLNLHQLYGLYLVLAALY